jgi:hypothetical protein
MNIQLVSKYRHLERIETNSFALPLNPYAPSNARLHYVPILFPDGNYIAQGYVSDLLYLRASGFLHRH